MPGRSRKRGRREAPGGPPTAERPRTPERSRITEAPRTAEPPRATEPPPPASAESPRTVEPPHTAEKPTAPTATAPTAATATTETAAEAGPPSRGRELPAHLPPPKESRSEVRNAEIRATLAPYAAGERPRVVLVSTAIAAALALANLICWLAGVKIEGRNPAATGIIVFTVVLLACAGGLWQMRAGAVLGFMCLMAILAILFTLFLIEASNVLGVVVALAIIVVSGYLFFKLVRVLSRLQMPREAP